MKFDLDWTLKSGPAEAPSVLELNIEYSYSFGSPDSWMEPDDIPEMEIEEVTYGVPNSNAKYGFDFIPLSLISAEEARVINHVMKNPPEPPDYDWDY